MSLISIANLTFRYEGSVTDIFRGVSFQFDTNWKLGCIGRNGRGKTTLLRLLMGALPHSGVITSPLPFSYFPFDVSDVSKQTLFVAEQWTSRLQEWRLKKELSLLGLDEGILSRPYETLSGGERMKVQLATLFIKDDVFFLIDEPTNHLDDKGRECVAEYLNSKRGFIVVSHDRYFLDMCVDHVIALNKQGVEIQRGNYASWKENSDKQELFELAKHQQLAKEAKKLKQAARNALLWSEKAEKGKKGVQKVDSKTATLDRGYVGHKAAKMMKRSKNLQSRQEKAVLEKETLLKNFEKEEVLSIHPKVSPQKILVEANDLSLYYGERKVCGPLNFSIQRGDRVSLSGSNGAGKSTLLKLIIGAPIRYSGSIWISRALIHSFVTQETDLLFGSLKAFMTANAVNEPLFKAILSKLGVGKDVFDVDMATMSQGQKKKLLIARSLSEQAHLYVWDEPLNYVDIASRLQIQSLIESHQPTMVFVEHDKLFSQKIATKNILIKN